MPSAGQGIDPRDGGSAGSSQHFTSVTCPFCGLHCDDLEVAAAGRHLRVVRNGCLNAKAGFERAIADLRPQIAGRDVPLGDAIAEAARLVREARLPLFGGLGTDVEGMRALMALADRAGGVVDHALSAAQYRNTGVLQTQGWVMSTLTETRNRADLVIVVGSDLIHHHTRFYERILAPAETMFLAEGKRRHVVLLGPAVDLAVVKSQGVSSVEEIVCDADALPAVVGALRAIMKGRALAADIALPGGVDALAALAERCKAAAYGVFVWAPQALTFPGGDLAVELITDIVRDLNKDTRAAGLSLGGNDGAASAVSVCSWQSGYPLRVSFASGAPVYDPYRFDIARMAAAGEGDLLVWTASIDHRSSPPAADMPLVLIGTPGITSARTPDVFLPVATPGLDQAGRLIRCDGVVSLPVRALRSAHLPAVPDVARALLSAL